MTTGEQYAQTHGTHGMGIAMPGMGAAIPMPGLAKAGTRIPGMASESGEPAPAPEVEHVRCASGLVGLVNRPTLIVWRRQCWRRPP